MEGQAHPADFGQLTSEVVSAFVSNNKVSTGDLPALIQRVHDALKNTANSVPAEPERPTPAVPINKTVYRDYIVSLEDGRKYQSLKRHLTSRGITPEQYRTKWGLRPDHPMVCASYSEKRSQLARSFGLGQARKGAKKPAT